MHVEKKESKYHSKYVTALLRRYAQLDILITLSPYKLNSYKSCLNFPLQTVLKAPTQ